MAALIRRDKNERGIASQSTSEADYNCVRAQRHEFDFVALNAE